MPSSGYPIETIIDTVPEDQRGEVAQYVIDAAHNAMRYGLFTEWLESFVGAWNKTKDVRLAAWSGLEEWDL